MTFIALTCDTCGGYGDIICTECQKRGLREYCYCEKCIAEHREGDQEEEMTRQEMEADKQNRRESMDTDTAHRQAAGLVSWFIQTHTSDIATMLAGYYTPDDAQVVKREIKAIAEHLKYESKQGEDPQA